MPKAVKKVIKPTPKQTVDEKLDLLIAYVKAIIDNENILAQNQKVLEAKLDDLRNKTKK